MRTGGRIVLAAVLVASGFLAADTNTAAEQRRVEFGARTMALADTWYRQNLTYSQDQCFRVGIGYTATDWNVLGGCHLPYYRTDCSGFVSMTWGLPHSYATPRPGDGQDLGDLTYPIAKDELSTGDALVAAGKHVRLFEKWLDAGKTRYRAYDFGSTPVKHQEYVWEAPEEYHYTPVRYVRA